ncbi:Piwi domain-containing protein [Thermoflexus sp.]|uniref:Piwi domain-containing protein n=1 Tax=Thermoflexus sp. TaxID=1969742 RepID=UPI0025D04E3F|nr:Piwi domain-containing protein [Thermoflexus sp.]MCS7350616.1 Piwi domain-containing protein [Thermoflexus sp.]MCX7689690.1 Piwi domain-containing protein [Thermoflexus sp.]MDW8180067.1 Piwi domain-containing protein [Anaerolineae bacterium]
MKYFVGERLSLPVLRFSAASTSQRDYYPRRGIQNYGPYDAMILGKDKVTCAVIFPVNLQNIKQTVLNGLQNGNGSFVGFHKLFRIPLVIIGERRVTAETPQQLDTVLPSLIRDLNPDIVLLLTSTRNPAFYARAKSILLGNGIPSQFITQEKLLNPDQLPWLLENVSLQMYAKIGGTPWTVMSSQKQKTLVLGVSRAQDIDKRIVVGFVTLFNSDGDYLFFSTIAPKPVYWERPEVYREALAEVIVNAYREYEDREGTPDEIVVHLCKKPGRLREFPAVEQAMQTLGANRPYAILHLNEYSNYRLFDTAHSSYIPQPGIKVNLSATSALLFLDGRKKDFRTGEETRKKRGVPRLIEIGFDKRSTLPTSEFPRLVRQVFEFASVNWRGFNAQSIPATLNYSRLIADLIAEIGADNWSQCMSQMGRLADKAWFL